MSSAAHEVPLAEKWSVVFGTVSPSRLPEVLVDSPSIVVSHPDRFGKVAPKLLGNARVHLLHSMHDQRRSIAWTQGIAELLECLYSSRFSQHLALFLAGMDRVTGVRGALADEVQDVCRERDINLYSLKVPILNEGLDAGFYRKKETIICRVKGHGKMCSWAHGIKERPCNRISGQASVPSRRWETDMANMPSVTHTNRGQKRL